MKISHPHHAVRKHKRIRFGMRTAKTALSVAIALAIAYATARPYAAFMAIGALSSMQRSITASLRSARENVLGNLFGACLATVVVLLFRYQLVPESFLPLITGIGTILLLTFCSVANIKNAANLSCVVFVCLMVDINSGASLFYGFQRAFDTLIGVLIALIVNIVIRPYNLKPRIFAILQALQADMIPLLEQRVLRCRIPELDEIEKNLDRLHKEIDLAADEKYNSTLSQKDIAYIRGCEQLVTKMRDALSSICALDATPTPNDENLERLYALGLKKTEQDNFLDGKCTFEDRLVLNYYLKIFLDANDYLHELLEL